MTDAHKGPHVAETLPGEAFGFPGQTLHRIGNTGKYGILGMQTPYPKDIYPTVQPVASASSRVADIAGGAACLGFAGFFAYNNPGITAVIGFLVAAGVLMAKGMTQKPYRSDPSQAAFNRNTPAAG